MRVTRLLLLWFCAQLCPIAPLHAEPVRIFAAASLKGALDAVIEARALDAVPVYGGSAAMARQVAQGAGADIVLLAHPEWMDWLDGQGIIERGSRCNLLGNALVLAGPAQARAVWPENAADLIDALDGGRLATGNLRAVPAGQYTAAYLQGQGWLAGLRPHLAETQNVRLALALVARGEAPLGFVYASDVAAEPLVRTVFRPQSGHVPLIRYPMALTVPARSAAVPVFQALSEAGAMFAAHGFEAVPLDEAQACQ